MITTITRTGPGVRIVVLAAGFSARLGRPKALARVRGATLLQRTLAVLAPFTGRCPVTVVIPPRSNRYRRGVPCADWMVNPQRAAGLSSSVRAALARARCDAAVLLLPVDLARLERRDVQRLLKSWQVARRQVIARRLPQGAAGIPLILPHRLFAAAARVTGDRGLREFVNGLPAGQIKRLALPSAAADVDTPRDLERARRGPYGRI